MLTIFNIAVETLQTLNLTDKQAVSPCWFNPWRYTQRVKPLHCRFLLLYVMGKNWFDFIDFHILRVCKVVPYTSEEVTLRTVSTKLLCRCVHTLETNHSVLASILKDTWSIAGKRSLCFVNRTHWSILHLYKLGS